MPDHLSADFMRRERITDTLLEFERRMREQVLFTDDSECWDLLMNRPPTQGGHSPYPEDDPLPLRYETHDQVSLLRVIVPEAPNRACLTCDLFGRSHCCGGVVFLYYALRDAGVTRPLDWLAVEFEQDLYLPDWLRMQDNSARILRKVRDYFEAHLKNVSAAPDA